MGQHHEELDRRYGLCGAGLGIGLVGYAMKALDYPIAPLVLAMVLGDRTEDAFRQAMLLSGGDILVFLRTPLAGTLSGLALACLALPVLRLLARR